MNRKLLYLLLCLCPLLWLASCEDNDSIQYIPASQVAPYTGVYRGKMATAIEDMETGKMWQQVKIDVVDDQVVLTMESFRVGDVEFGDVVLGGVQVQENGGGLDFYTITNLQLAQSQVNVELKATLSGSDLEVNYTLRSVLMPSVYASMTAAKTEHVLDDSVAIVEMKINDELVLMQPEVFEELHHIQFAISDTIADTARIVLYPEFVLYNGCTSSLNSGDSLDFTRRWAEMVVWAEDSIHRAIYRINCVEVRSYPARFDDWQIEPIQETDSLLTYLKPDGWETNNAWIRCLKKEGLYARTYPYPVVPTISRKGGDYAARIMTIRTHKAGHEEIPGLHGGELFWGNYMVDPEKLTDSTGYGVTFDTHPVSVNGWYKYLPGKIYYENHEQVEGKQDTCVMIGVLYEVKSMDETISPEQIPEDPRIIALGYFETGKTERTYVPFEFKFTFLDLFNTNRKYKLAVIFRSSKYGYLHEGASGSELYVDEVNIIGL